MISLLSAAYMFGAVGLAVPIILHLLRRRPRKLQPFPSFRFIHATAARKQSRNNIRKLLVLLLRCLILLLLAIGFSWPYLQQFNRPPEQLTVMLWDCSFSMQAEPYRKELFDQAMAVLDGCSEGRPAAIGMLTDRVLWSGDFTEDIDSLRTWFEDKADGYGTSRLARALRLADRKLQNTTAPAKRIVLITDRQLVPWQGVRLSEPLSPGVKLELITPNKPGFKNLAVVEAKVAGPFTDANQQLTLQIRLQNYHYRPVVGELVTTWAGVQADRRLVEVEALGQKKVAVPVQAKGFDPQFGKIVLINIQEGDELTVDNTAWVVANPSRFPKVYLQPMHGAISRLRRQEIDYIRAALVPGGGRSAAEIEDLSDETTPEKLRSAGVIILRRGISLDSHFCESLDEALRDGRTVIATWRDTPIMRQWLDKYGVVSEAVPRPGTRRLAAVDFDHPVFAPFLDVRTAGLFKVLFYDPPQMKLPEGARILARFDDGGAAIAELDIGDGKLIVVAADMSRDSTDWPLCASFLPFWRQLLVYSDQAGELETSFSVSSNPLQLGQIERARDLAAGDDVELKRGRFIADRPGVFLVSQAGEDLAIAVNLPPEESDPLLLSDDFAYEKLVSREPLPDRDQKAALASADESRSFWWIVLVTALAATVAEIVLSNRVAL